VSDSLPVVGDVLEHLVVDAVDDEGRGRCVLGQGAQAIDIAVRGAFPGDVVAARVERIWASRRLVQARSLSAAGEGPLHKERACAHRGPCAACPLHGVDEGFVLAFKRARVERAFAELGLVVDIEDTVPGSGQRQKVKLVAAGTPGRLLLGHYAPHSHDVVDATGCGHADDELQDAVRAVRQRLDAHRLGPAVVAAVIARRFVEGVAVVIVGTGPPPVPLALLWPETVRGVAWRVPGAAQSENAIVGGVVHQSVGELRGTSLGAARGDPVVEVDTFCQADPVSAQVLVQKAVDFVVDQSQPGEAFADLYAGTGAFARALVDRGRAVVAVENFPASASALARVPGVQAVCARVEEAGQELASFAPVGIVADPPRKGLGVPLVQALVGLPARRVALVSCDVDAGARDVQAFVHAGFRVAAVIPVDLFPGSAEVEVLTLLLRD
jgi:23S rRNA (uracil1939-C5)-methyltransferase